MVDAGYRSIDALDISAAALDQLRERLGHRAGAIRFTRADARDASFDPAVAVWHDRAVFHFLIDPADQAAYARRAAGAVGPGGWLVMATFSPAGPDACSGLPVARHSAESLASVFADFELVEDFERDHKTPWGTSQSFTHALMRRG
jgi:SAM-dependent methyltransferase